MNLSALLNFESQKYIGAQTQSSAVNTFVGHALRCLIVDFYQHIAPAFIVIISCRRTSPLNFYRNIMQLLYNSVDNMIVQLVYLNISRPETMQRIGGARLHNILLVDSLEAFLDIEIHTYTEHNDANEYYYIFLQQRDAKIPHDMQAIMEYCWQHQLINCNVQIQQSDGVVTMHTYFPYTAEHCAEVLPVEIDRFLGNCWEKNVFFPDKLQNFYNCPLVVAVRNELPFLEATYSHVNELSAVYMLRGLEGSLLQELSKRLNFTLKLLIHNDSNELELHELLYGHAAHMAIGYMRKRAQHSQNLTTVFPHYANILISSFLLSQYNLTSFQMLSFPFQHHAWLSILATVILIYIMLLYTISFVQRQRQRQNVYFTLDFSKIWLNVYAVTLGLPIKTPPISHLSRIFLFISWMTGTLLLRTMYAALIFYLVRHQVQQRLPDTIDELLQRDFISIVNRISLADLEMVPYFKKIHNQSSTSSLIILDSTNEKQVLQKLETYKHLKHAYGIVSRDVLMEYVWQQHKPGLFYIMPDYIVQQQLAIYLQKHSFLVAKFDESIMAIQAVGLINYWSHTLLNAEYFSSNRFRRSHNVLRVTQLYGIFVIGGLMYIIATIILFCEMILKRRNSKY